MGIKAERTVLRFKLQSHIFLLCVSDLVAGEVGMAGNVFGDPITDQTLKQMPYMQSRVSREDRANLAMEKKNDKGKEECARQYVEQLKKEYGDEGVCTLCVVYNATGDSLTIARVHDFMGHIWKSPYPLVIQNGQWGAFLHVAGDSGGSKGFVVYHCKSISDWMLAWCTTSNLNQVYPKFGHFYDPDLLQTVSDSLAESGVLGTHSSGGVNCIASTGNGTNSPLLESILTFTTPQGFTPTFLA